MITLLRARLRRAERRGVVAMMMVLFLAGVGIPMLLVLSALSMTLRAATKATAAAQVAAYSAIATARPDTTMIVLDQTSAYTAAMLSLNGAGLSNLNVTSGTGIPDCSASNIADPRPRTCTDGTVRVRTLASVNTGSVSMQADPNCTNATYCWRDATVGEYHRQSGIEVNMMVRARIPILGINLSIPANGYAEFGFLNPTVPGGASSVVFNPKPEATTYTPTQKMAVTISNVLSTAAITCRLLKGSTSGGYSVFSGGSLSCTKVSSTATATTTGTTNLLASVWVPDAGDYRVQVTVKNTYSGVTQTKVTEVSWTYESGTLPSISLNPVSYTFGGRNPGDTTSPPSIAVFRATNTSSTSIVLTGASVPTLSNTTDFTFVTLPAGVTQPNCAALPGGVLASGSTCAVAVRFLPQTIDPLIKTATLSFGTSAVPASLAGTAQATMTWDNRRLVMTAHQNYAACATTGSCWAEFIGVGDYNGAFTVGKVSSCTPSCTVVTTTALGASRPVARITWSGSIPPTTRVYFTYGPIDPLTSSYVPILWGSTGTTVTPSSATRVTMTPTSADFGLKAPGSGATASKTFTATNAGTYAVAVTTPGLSNTTDFGATISAAGGCGLVPNGILEMAAGCTIDAYFRPAAATTTPYPSAILTLLGTNTSLTGSTVEGWSNVQASILARQAAGTCTSTCWIDIIFNGNFKGVLNTPASVATCTPSCAPRSYTTATGQTINVARITWNSTSGALSPTVAVTFQAYTDNGNSITAAPNKTILPMAP